MRFKVSMAIIFLLCLGCKNNSGTGEDKDIIAPKTKMKFDQEKWLIQEGKDYPYRDFMLKDLVYNDSIRSLNKEEILQMLGEPTRTNEGYLYYRITQENLFTWPLHTKTMVIKFTDQDSIEWIKIHE